MPDRAVIASEAAQRLRCFRASIASTPVMIGFDGFVDSIIQVVDQRVDTEHYEAVETIDHFGRKIRSAAGRSSNYELITTRRKLGGNGPIMANAMAKAGLAVTYIGCLGHPQLDPVFDPLAARAEVHSIAPPGLTDALEFTDGKLLLGKYDHLGRVDDRALHDAVGKQVYHGLIGRSRLFGMVNWTMLTQMNAIWRDLIDQVLPAVGDVGGLRRFVFIDLADPEKRTRGDLSGALDLIREMDQLADVILGLNLKESTQVAEVLDVAVAGDPVAQIESTASAIREKLSIYGTVVHPRRAAAAALRGSDGVCTGCFRGPFVASPKLSTGAGDNFNAGFCLGQLAGLDLHQSLCAGTATSGFYVRNAGSPSLDELADFCEQLPDPE